MCLAFSSIVGLLEDLSSSGAERVGWIALEFLKSLLTSGAVAVLWASAMSLQTTPKAINALRLLTSSGYALFISLAFGVGLGLLNLVTAYQKTSMSLDQFVQTLTWCPNITDRFAFVISGAAQLALLCAGLHAIRCTSEPDRLSVFSRRIRRSLSVWLLGNLVALVLMLKIIWFSPIPISYYAFSCAGYWLVPVALAIALANELRSMAELPATGSEA